jgi:hypothetical protein
LINFDFNNSISFILVYMRATWEIERVYLFCNIASGRTCSLERSLPQSHPHLSEVQPALIDDTLEDRVTVVPWRKCLSITACLEAG